MARILALVILAVALLPEASRLAQRRSSSHGVLVSASGGIASVQISTSIGDSVPARVTTLLGADSDVASQAPTALATVSEDGAVALESVQAASAPRVVFRHPRNGSFVTVGERVLLDVAVEGGGDASAAAFAFPDPAKSLLLCVESRAGGPIEADPAAPPATALRRPSAGATCFDAPGPKIFASAAAGTHTLRAVLVRRAAATDPASAAAAGDDAEPLADAVVHFEAAPRSQCEEVGRGGVSSSTVVAAARGGGGGTGGLLGNTPCSVLRAGCSRFARIRFLLYPQTWVPSQQAAALYYALQGSPLRTENPADACLFVSVGDVRAANVVRESVEASAERLTRLPLWGNGENHVVFHFGDYAPGYDVQRAILAASSFGPPYDRAALRPSDPESLPQLAQERVGHDVVMPMPFYRCGFESDTVHLHKFDGAEVPPQDEAAAPEELAKAGATLAPLLRARAEAIAALVQGGMAVADATAAVAATSPPARPYLLTFKGSLYGFPDSHHASARRFLRQALHNGRDIIVALTCWSLSPDCRPCDRAKGCLSPPLVNVTSASYSDCPAITAEADGWGFSDLLLRTRFAAILPGEGTHSYRLYEALQAGAIPVLLGVSARPLEPLIRWQDMAVIWPDTSIAGLHALEAVLRAISAPARQRMQKFGRLAFDAHFSDIDAQVHSLFATLALRFDEGAKQIKEGKEREAEEEARRNATAALVAAGAVTAEAPPAAAASAAPAAGPPSPSPAPAAAAAATTHPFDPFPRNLAVSDADHAAFEAAVVARAAAHAHLLAAAQKEVASALEFLGPLQQAVLLAINSSMHAAAAGASSPAIPGALTEALRGPQAGAVAAHLSAAIESWLTWLALAYPCPHDRVVSASVRSSVAGVYATLSQAYGLLGHVRHAVTAMQGVLLVSGTERFVDKALLEGDTRRARNTVLDLRRTPATAEALGAAAGSVGPGHPLRLLPGGRLARMVDATSELDAVLLNGLGGLGRFSGPVPLASVTGPGMVVPLVVDAAAAPVDVVAAGAAGAGQHHRYRPRPLPTSPVPFALVPELTYRRVAAAVAAKLPSSFRAFRTVHALAPLSAKGLSIPDCAAATTEEASRGAGGATPKRRGSRVAIVSLCAYDAAVTNLTAISTANLQGYCNRHGYDCFLASSGLDSTRPLAWSKALLVANFLPRFDWVVWRDCDSFFLDPEVTVEDLVAGAAKAREVVGEAAARTLGEESVRGWVGAPATGAGGEAPAAPAPVAAVVGKTLRFSSGGPEKAASAVGVGAGARGGAAASVDPSACDRSSIRHDDNDLPLVQDVMACAMARTAGVVSATGAAAAQLPPPRLPSATSPFPPPVSPPLPSCDEAVPLASSTLDLIISEDGLMVNTGVWIIRNSAWSMSWLRRIYGDHSDVGTAAAGAAAKGDGPSSADVSSPGHHLLPFRIEQVAGSMAGAELACVASLRLPSDPEAAASASLQSMRGVGRGQGRVVPADEGGLPLSPPSTASASASASSVLNRTGFPFVDTRMWEQGGALFEFAFEGQTAWRRGADGSGSGGVSADPTATVTGLLGRGGVCSSAATPAQSPPHDAPHDATPPTPSSCGLPSPSAYSDALHSQFVPQEWLNAYPPAIARAIVDHRGHPLHAEVVADGEGTLIGANGTRPPPLDIEGETLRRLERVSDSVRRGTARVGDPASAPWPWVVSFSGCTAFYVQGVCNSLFEKYAAAAQAALEAAPPVVTLAAAGGA